MKNKTYQYHTSHGFTAKDGEKITFNTQLYSTGVYGIINNNAGMQGSFEPKDIVKMEKVLKNSLEKGEIKDLVFGALIKVEYTENGYVEITTT